MKISPNFVIQEFVYPELFAAMGQKSIWYIDPKIVNICEFIRVKTGKAVTVNNWHTGGQYKESGLRRFNTTTGARMSLHKFGKAADIKVKGMTPPEVFEFIKSNWIELRNLGLTTVEDVTFTRSWSHLDCRNTGKSELLIVRP